jgi:cation transporter-like permease
MHAACYSTRTHVGAVENQRRTDIFEEDAAASYIMYQTLILSLFLVILMSLDVKY